MNESRYIAEFGLDRARDTEGSVLNLRRSSFFDAVLAPVALALAVGLLVGLWAGMTIGGM